MDVDVDVDGDVDVAGASLARPTELLLAPIQFHWIGSKNDPEDQGLLQSNELSLFSMILKQWLTYVAFVHKSCSCVKNILIEHEQIYVQILNFLLKLLTLVNNRFLIQPHIPNASV